MVESTSFWIEILLFSTVLFNERCVTNQCDKDTNLLSLAIIL